jgi:hypothetical protein
VTYVVTLILSGSGAAEISFSAPHIASTDTQRHSSNTS